MSSEAEFLETMGEWARVVMHHSMHGLIHYTKENGLSMSQTVALFKIKRNGMCGVADVGEDLQVSSAAASQMLDRLVQQGFIQRSENPEDRRGKCLTLTDKGQAFLQKGIHVRQRWIKDLADSLSIEERQSANETIAMLVGKARALDAGAKNPHCEGEGTLHS
ncbi:MAG TPA: MarR family transcriptional regulator [Rectinemataceae bacterium]|nr:MarR family transcriptional regulator [Rectinemataceae bacterium]